MNKFYNASFLPLGVLLLLALCFSFSSPFFSFSRDGVANALVGTPKLWLEGGSVVEAARGFLDLGRFDAVVAPNVLLGKPYYVNTPGFPVAASLAAMFKLFGVGVLQVRIVALLWLLAAVVVMCVVWKSFFGARAAFLGTLLVVTFASFYGAGKTMSGEVPGFLWMLLSLFSLYKKQNFGWGGFFAALSLVTKPSMFLFLAPVLALEFALYERPFWRSAVRAALGALPVIVVWLFVMFPNIASPDSWQGAATIYQNHYPEPAALASLSGFLGAVLHPTFIYFMLFFSVLIVARFCGRFVTSSEVRLVNAALLYGAVALIYFLRSPGWFRYLLGLSLLLLLFVPVLLDRLIPWVRQVWRDGALYLLAIFQIAVFFFFSNIRSGLEVPALAQYLDERILQESGVTVGVVDAVQVSAFVPSDKKFSIIHCGGDCVFGRHPLSYGGESPTYVLVPKNLRAKTEIEYRETLRLYRSDPDERFGMIIYKRK